MLYPLPYHILKDIFYYLNIENLINLKNYLSLNDKNDQLIEIIDSLYSVRYIYYNYSQAYGQCDPIIIDAPDLGTTWKIVLFYELKINIKYIYSDLAYTLFDMRDIKITLKDNSVELSVCKEPQANFLKTHFPDYYEKDEEHGILIFSYEEFYLNLAKLKYMTVHDKVFPTDDPFPSWEYSLRPVTIKKSDPYLIMNGILLKNEYQSMDFKYESSRDEIELELDDRILDDNGREQWKRSYLISDLKQLP
jgi:hypothetical protein